MEFKYLTWISDVFRHNSLLAWHAHCNALVRMTELEERLAFSHSRSLTAFGFKKSCELLCNLISCKMYSESYDSLNWIEDLQFQSWTGDWQHLKLDLLNTANPKAHAHPSQQWKLPGLMFYTAKAGDSSSWIYWMQQRRKCALILSSAMKTQS